MEKKMKRKFMPAVSFFVVMALAACGPKPAPELSVTDVQNTAVALALTEIAITQSAIPTNTPVPPTPTTDMATLAILPTVALETPIVAPPASSIASPTPDCYQPAPPTKDLLGTTVNIKFVNKADGPVSLSMGMYAPNDQGECYTFGLGISNNGSEVVTILSGCYWISGYQNGPKPSTPRADYICLTDTNQTRGVTINNNSIGFD